MKIVYNKLIPFKGYKIMNLFGVLFVRGEKGKVDLTEDDINHEAIHTAQMREMGYIFFYLWYGIEYVLIRLFHRKQGCAYHDVSFEEEAHTFDRDLNYLENRRHYEWTKYLKIRSNPQHAKDF